MCMMFKEKSECCSNNSDPTHRQYCYKYCCTNRTAGFVFAAYDPILTFFPLTEGCSEGLQYIIENLVQDHMYVCIVITYNSKREGSTR